MKLGIYWVCTSTINESKSIMSNYDITSLRFDGDKDSDKENPAGFLFASVNGTDILEARTDFKTAIRVMAQANVIKVTSEEDADRAKLNPIILLNKFGIDRGVIYR